MNVYIYYTTYSMMFFCLYVHVALLECNYCWLSKSVMCWI